MSSSEIPTGRMIFKVLIVGNDLPLQTGFLSRASGGQVSCQLYNAVGLSLGVAKFDFPDNLGVVLQLWSIPHSERMEGLSRNLTKGHRAIILIIRPHEIESIPEMFHRLNLSLETPVMVVVVGSVRDTEACSYQLDAFFGCQMQVQAFQSVEEIMTVVAEGLVPNKFPNSQLPMIVSMDEEICPLYEPVYPATHTPPNSMEEISEISIIAAELGLRIVGDLCAVELDEGVAWISMKTGAIQMEPGICRYCSHSCKRQANICIVSADAGWSSTNLGSRALLTIAKIYSLTARMLPNHVRKQIERTNICDRFDPNPIIPIEDIPDSILLGFKHSDSGRALLEAAKKRVKEGRLSKEVYTILKKKLHNLETSRTD
ncbi:MAG: hypothetical protein ACFFFK_04295 [Candidatus Thorarchaeota archaeon]